MKKNKTIKIVGGLVGAVVLFLVASQFLGMVIPFLVGCGAGAGTLKWYQSRKAKQLRAQHTDALLALDALD